MNDSRRTFLHNINAWLIPAIAAALIGIGGYIGLRTITTGDEVTRIGTIQIQVRNDQLAMKKTLNDVSETVQANGIKLDQHLMASGFQTKSNSTLHHRQGVSPCTGCHGTEQRK